MKRAFLLSLASLASCTTVAQNQPHIIAVADLRSSAGALAGTATISEVLDRINLSITTARLSPGQHGLHLHSIGQCTAPDFASAGPHLNPAGHQHGTANPAGPHLGDLANLSVAENGLGGATAVLPGTAAEIEAALFDGDGTAIVIHAAADDNRTDPSGNSGARIACGVFARRGG
jgi:superoxide dismutase, Cu-Zn family